MPAKKMDKNAVGRELDSLDLLPPEQAADRTDDLLRNMLRSPPEPHALSPRVKRTAAKKPSQKPTGRRRPPPDVPLTKQPDDSRTKKKKG